MRILMVASEAAPFAKTGGLADVLMALPRALVRLGHAVDVILPRYRGVAQGARVGTVTALDGGVARDADIYGVITHGVRTLFVDHPAYFDRDHLYGPAAADYPDNAARFAFLTRAALAWAGDDSHSYDLVHAHDWQAGLIPVLHRGPTVFTIHNLAYQGIFDAEWLSLIGLRRELMSVDALEYWGRISLLKGGIVFSRMVTTVSPRYAEEIQTEEYGFGFDGILRSRRADLAGILNGIDYDEWNPATDRYVGAPYDAVHLEGKSVAKRQLLETVGLQAGERELQRPVVGMVSRLVDQKGFDLIAEAVDDLLRMDATYVLLGNGEQRYEALWRSLAAAHPDRVAVRIGFDERLAHQIEAGADLFLMPSRFEPCGLNQMYSLRYGTVPVVRAVGGLFDTVQNVDLSTGAGTGFAFTPYSPAALVAALRQAIRTYKDRDAWRRIQAAGMALDLSWENSARRYVEVYERATI
jgi:starch synthase